MNDNFVKLNVQVIKEDKALEAATLAQQGQSVPTEYYDDKVLHIRMSQISSFHPNWNDTTDTRSIINYQGRNIFVKHSIAELEMLLTGTE